jgi:hypothetical protein
MQQAVVKTDVAEGYRVSGVESEGDGVTDSSKLEAKLSRVCSREIVCNRLLRHAYKIVRDPPFSTRIALTRVDDRPPKCKRLRRCAAKSGVWLPWLRV